MIWRKILWPLAAVLAFLTLWLKQANPWKDRAEKAAQTATQAQLKAIDLKADLDKEKIKHETEQALADAGFLSDADIVAAAVDEFRRRYTNRVDLEDPPTDD